MAKGSNGWKRYRIDEQPWPHRDDGGPVHQRANDKRPIEYAAAADQQESEHATFIEFEVHREQEEGEDGPVVDHDEQPAIHGQ